jgi:hypothetical protein
MREPPPGTKGVAVFNQLLPRQIDNTYRGYRLALWLFAVLVLVKVAMSLNCIFNGRTVAISADGIPLDAYPSAAAQTIVALFAIWGLAHLMFSAVSVVVLIRYRNMVPLMFTLLLLEHLGRRLTLYFIPLVRTGTPPGFFVNLALLTVMLVGLALSLLGRRDVRAQQT